MKAFAVGLPAILLGAILGYLSRTHFDGVIDAHVNDTGNIYMFITEALIDYAVLLFTLYIAGIIISGFHFRFVDMMGTVALARFPMIFVPLATFALPQQKLEELINSLLKQEAIISPLTALDWTGLFLGSLIMILCLVWMIVLLVNAYKICVNKRGAALVISFILALFIAEIVSKVAIINIFPVLNPINNLLP